MSRATVVLPACPRCSDPLEGFATWCFRCEAYIADMVEAKGHGRDHSGDRESKAPRVAGLESESNWQGLATLDTRSEDDISTAIQTVLELHGFDVWSLEQGYRRSRGGTRQTPGIADLFVVGHRYHTWVELKSATGSLRESQERFRDICQANGVPWALWRHEADAIAWAEDVRRAA